MTPTESLATIGWSIRECARRIGKPENTVRSWHHRDTWPPDVEAWLDRVARAVVALPPPG